MKIKFLSTYDRAKNLLRIMSQVSELNKNSEKIINRINTNIPAYKKNSVNFDTFVSGMEKAEK